MNSNREEMSEQSSLCLMMEQSEIGKSHRHPIFFTSLHHLHQSISIRLEIRLQRKYMQIHAFTSLSATLPPGCATYLTPYFEAWSMESLIFAYIRKKRVY